MANFVINNTALRNNGDVALVKALSSALESKGHQVTFATAHLKYARNVQGYEDVCRDVYGYNHRILRQPIPSRVAALWLLLTSKAYRQCDVLVGAPGGYINSNYGFDWKMEAYRWARQQGKKTAIYSQSIGPLSDSDRLSLHLLGSCLDVMLVRDGLSYRTAIEAGFPSNHLLQSIDAIFLAVPAISVQSAGSSVVAMSVREWAHQKRDISRYMNCMREMAWELIMRGFHVEFISTCQGVHGYIDDSLLAAKIANSIRKQHGEDVPITLVTKPFTIDDLRKRISTYRMVVGTRLHMCLLAMIEGVPAFNVSYESKGAECYKYLGLGEFSIDYNEDITAAVSRLRDFLFHENEIRMRLPSSIREHHSRAWCDFNAFLERLEL